MGKRYEETFVLVTAVAVWGLELKDYKNICRHELYLILKEKLRKKQVGLWDSYSQCCLGLKNWERTNAK